MVTSGDRSTALTALGPFDTAEEAARAPQIMQERSKKWADDEARDSDWGSGSGR